MMIEEMITGFGRAKLNSSPTHIYFDQGVPNHAIDVKIYGSNAKNGTYIDLTGDELYYTISYKTSKNCANEVYQTFGSSSYVKFKVYCETYVTTFTGTWKADNY